MAVTSAAVCTVTAGVHRHWLLGPIGSNVNQCSTARRSSTAYRDGVQRQRSYLTSNCPTLQAPSAGTCEEMAASSGVPTVGGPVDNGGKTYDHHLQADRATIQELCTQLEPDLMSAIRHPTGIPPQVQVPFLQEDGPDGGVVAAVEPVDSEDEEAEEEDMDNRDSVIQQYFQ
ncbi:hypothetical protein NDU88_006268 [Pleurodeles waltl]|uniref:Uncharacterized protein n=1 Tax=Pleurodeles waltl TaxID=8319 RepID=A0AAV7RL34_PLEWA|nr:hypothetical protein NDU88_006268 [Pleurodeles waltl]